MEISGRVLDSELNALEGASVRLERVGKTFANGVVVSYRGSWVSSDEPTYWAGDWRMECGGRRRFPGRRGRYRLYSDSQWNCRSASSRRDAPEIPEGWTNE